MIRRFFSTIPIKTELVKQTKKKLKKEKSLATIPPIKNEISRVLPTPRHKIYSDFLTKSQVEMVFAIGPAGTGKTYLACQEAIQQLKRNEVEKIIITRPMVCNDEELGFLPGNIESKMDPWTRPIIDIFQEHYPLSQIQNMMSNRKIECSPLAYMRGRTFNNSFIIGDEMQNATDNQMKMFLTRIGKKSKMVITGDIEQIDNSIGDDGSGLFLFYERYADKCRDHLILENKSQNEMIEFDVMNKLVESRSLDIFEKIKWIEFQKEDIQRNPIISQILDLYEETDNNEDYYHFNFNQTTEI